MQKNVAILLSTLSPYVLINLLSVKISVSSFLGSFHATNIVLIDLKKNPSVFFYSYLLSSHNDRCINILI